MGRTSKFSFPLRGRKNRQQSLPNDAIVGNQQLLSKAERVLGMSTNSSANRKEVNQSSVELRNKRSHVSLLISEKPVTPEDPQHVEPPPNFNLSSFQPRSQPPSRMSHDVARELRSGHALEHSVMPPIRHQQSTSTLRTYYDPKRVPLSISQQTSNSAVRDMALRKGQPPILDAGVGADGRNDGGPLIRPNTSGGTIGRKKRKPALLNLSRLFPGQHGSSTPSTPALPANAVTMVPNLEKAFQKSPVAPIPTRSAVSMETVRKLSKSKKAESVDGSNPEFGARGRNGRLKHSNSRSTVGQAKPPGTQHWFDGLLEAEDEEDDEYGEVATQRTTQTVPIAFPEPLEFSEPREPSGRPFVQERKSRPRIQPPIERRFRQSSVQEVQIRSQRASLAPDPESYTTRSASVSLARSGSFRSWNSPTTKHVLPDASVLSTTDSESDADDIASHLPSVRDSIAVSDFDESIQIVEAHAFQVKPGVFREIIAADVGDESRGMANPKNKRHSATSMTLAVPQWASRLQDRKAAGHRPKSLRRSPPSSIRSGKSSRSHKTASESMNSAQAHKLMAVTKEEEVLLEMMRHKRAAMAKQSFAQGYNTAILQGSNSPALTAQSDDNLGVENSLVSASSKRRSLVYDPTVDLHSPPLSPPPTSPLPQLPEPYRNSGIFDSLPYLVKPSRNLVNIPPSAAALVGSAVNQQSDHANSGPGAESLDIKLNPLPTPGTTSYHSAASPTASSASHASVIASPMTPQLNRRSVDVAVKVASSSSGSESSVLDTPLDENLQTESKRLKMQPPTLHSRRRTASSSANIVAKPSSSTGTEDEEIHLSDSFVPTEDYPSYENIPRRDRRASSNTLGHLKNIQIAGRDRLGSRTGSYDRYDPSAERRPCQVHHVHHSLNDSQGSMHGKHCSDEESRCSVREDVLAAWGSLGGGWPDVPRRTHLEGLQE